MRDIDARATTNQYLHVNNRFFEHEWTQASSDTAKILLTSILKSLLAGKAERGAVCIRVVH